MLKWEHIAIDYQNPINFELKYFSQCLVATWKQFHFQTGLPGKWAILVRSRWHTHQFKWEVPRGWILSGPWHPKTDPSFARAASLWWGKMWRPDLCLGYSQIIDMEKLTNELTRLEILWHPKWSIIFMGGPPRAKRLGQHSKWLLYKSTYVAIEQRAVTYMNQAAVIGKVVKCHQIVSFCSF